MTFEEMDNLKYEIRATYDILESFKQLGEGNVNIKSMEEIGCGIEWKQITLFHNFTGMHLIDTINDSPFRSFFIVDENFERVEYETLMDIHETLKKELTKVC